MKKVLFFLLMPICLGYTANSPHMDIYKNVLTDKEVEKLASKTAYLLNNPDQRNLNTLFASLVDYFMLKGYKNEGYSEGINGDLYDMFYRNDSIGEMFDAYMNTQHITLALQDTIRFRLMYCVYSEYYLRADMQRYTDFPYLNEHPELGYMDLRGIYDNYIRK